MIRSAPRPLSGARGLHVCVLVFACVCGGQDLSAQTPTASPQQAKSSSSPIPVAKVSSSDEDGLSERLRRLEEINRQLDEQLKRTRQEHDAQMAQLAEKLEDVSSSTQGRVDGPSVDAVDYNGSLAEVEPTSWSGALSPDSPVNDYTEGLFAPFSEIPTYPDPQIAKPSRFPLNATFGPGFQLQTDDGRLRWQFHYESQIDARFWDEQDQIPANSGFFLPRQRFFFNGNITESVEYELAINRGVNNINVLNAYLNFHFDDRLEFRIGRFFTPFTFDQYAVSNYWLITPERSLFTTNLSPNRQIGSMAWGYLWDKRLEYAAGVFNGSRNSFESLDNSLDFVGFLNTRPFQESELLPFARFLNLGSSVAYGTQDQAPVPMTFRVGGGSPDANIPGIATVPFLILNPGVTERGNRLLGSVHGAYFYNSLSVIGEWQYGYGGYASPARPRSTRVPFAGYFVSAGYFLTGEHVERRTRLKPLYPLLPVNKEDERGMGALEAAGRVSRLRLGSEVFEGGLADPNLWSSSATTTELGLNWYWNEYIKWYMFWLHADFGSPVQFRPGDRQKTADMLWLRAQLYF